MNDGDGATGAGEAGALASELENDQDAEPGSDAPQDSGEIEGDFACEEDMILALSRPLPGPLELRIGSPICYNLLSDIQLGVVASAECDGFIYVRPLEPRSMFAEPWRTMMGVCEMLELSRPNRVPMEWLMGNARVERTRQGDRGPLYCIREIIEHYEMGTEPGTGRVMITILSGPPIYDPAFTLEEARHWVN
jgi:hypothetical protein